MTPKLTFYTDEQTFWHGGGNYAFLLPVGGNVQPLVAGGFVESPETKRRLRNLIMVTGLSKEMEISSAEPVDESDLLRIHPKHYLETFRDYSAIGHGDMGDFAPVGPGSYEIAKLSAGLVLEAVDVVVSGRSDRSYALSRPPGHHCLPEKGMGTCLLANIPIAIEAAKAKHGVGKVAVVDWDVHHGNGTQACFEDRSDVLTISIHQENCYPPGYSGMDDRGVGAGVGANLNIPLPAGSGHDTYLQVMRDIVMPSLDAFDPELIVVACGFDANSADSMARMMLHSETFREMTAMMKDAANRLCSGKLVFVHEGGYSEAYVPVCGHAVLEELCDVRTSHDDPLLEFFRAQQPGPEHAEFLTNRVQQLVRSLSA